MVCVLTKLTMLQDMDRLKAVNASTPKISWLKTVVSPPVVGVFVWESKIIKLWTVTWTITSIPKTKLVEFKKLYSL